MCGIFALLCNHTTDGNIFARVEPSFMKGKKRGPESTNFFIDPNTKVCLGFHRLAINGLDSESDQPLVRDNCRVICNGEIYNHERLFKDLNVVPKTKSDCEVLLHLYEKVGNACASMCDGVFAFVLLDERQKKVYVARDPYGVRPLYMCYYKNKNIAFSSDLDPLYFDNSIEKIVSFTPGTYATFRYQESWEMEHRERYFFPTSYLSLIQFHGSSKTIEYYMYHFVDRLRQAIRKRVNNCEREIGCLLSGGLDSSIISAYVQKMYKEKTGKSIETYSIGLEGGEDLEYASKMAMHIDSQHHEIVMTNEDFIRSIPNVIQDIESYDTTTVRASVGNWNIGKYISKKSSAKVIFNGDGSDELAGGYLYFHACPDDESFHNECLRLLNDIHKYDVLRSDKSISSHGLEPRTPFLDKELTRFYLSIPIVYRNHNHIHNQICVNMVSQKCEKYFIRKAIELYEPGLLPPDILWRKKEAFSDGVSSITKSWYEIIQEDIEERNYNSQLSCSHNAPKTKEQSYYRSLFEAYFGSIGAELIPYYWMPKFVENANDASARTLSVYETKS